MLNNILQFNYTCDLSFKIWFCVTRKIFDGVIHSILKKSRFVMRS